MSNFYNFTHKKIPKKRIPMIGTTEAIAIRPNPSTRGFLPLIELARPTPIATIRGTVIADVVTPPES